MCMVDGRQGLGFHCAHCAFDVSLVGSASLAVAYTTLLCNISIRCLTQCYMLGYRISIQNLQYRQQIESVCKSLEVQDNW